MKSLLKNRRAQVLKYYLSGHQNGVGLSELCQFLVSPTAPVLAKRKIKQIEQKDGFIVVWFHDLDRPLYYPESLSLDALYMVIPEITNQKDWHYYFFGGARIEPTDTVLDLGAAEGLFALYYHDRCQKMVVVEPSPVFKPALEKTFSGVDGVDIMTLALSNQPGIQRFVENGISSRLGEQGGIEVKTETIDRLFANEPVHFIKADLEGFELNVLEGARDTLKTHKPKLSITTYHNQDDEKEIRSFISSVRPDYTIVSKGIEGHFGSFVMLHAW